MLTKVIGFNDKDDSACQAIFHTLSTHGTIKLIFANGGDRSDTTTPEYVIYGDHPNVEFAFGVGGEDKKNLLERLENGKGKPLYKARIEVPILLPGEKTSTRIEPGKSLYAKVNPITRKLVRS